MAAPQPSTDEENEAMRPIKSAYLKYLGWAAHIARTTVPWAEGTLCASDPDHCAYEVGGSAQEVVHHHKAEEVEHQNRKVVYHLHV
jgi:hypothetical protein